MFVYVLVFMTTYLVQTCKNPLAKLGHLANLNKEQSCMSVKKAQKWVLVMVRQLWRLWLWWIARRWIVSLGERVIVNACKTTISINKWFFFLRKGHVQHCLITLCLSISKIIRCLIEKMFLYVVERNFW